MKATFDPTAPTKFTTTHRKDGKCFFSSMTVISLADKPYTPCLRQPLRIECRLYGTGSVNTCCIWANNGEIHTSGSGSAGGYGYHRPSQAMENAIRNAGFTLSESIGGVGETAMEEALIAMAKALGIKRPAIIRSHQ